CHVTHGVLRIGVRVERESELRRAAALAGDIHPKEGARRVRAADLAELFGGYGRHLDHFFTSAGYRSPGPWYLTAQPAVMRFGSDRFSNWSLCSFQRCSNVAFGLPPLTDSISWPVRMLHAGAQGADVHDELEFLGVFVRHGVVAGDLPHRLLHARRMECGRQR